MPRPATSLPQPKLPLAATPVAEAQLREKARALAIATPPPLRLDYAQAFCADVITRYWQGMRPRSRRALRELPARGKAIALRREGTEVAEALAAAATALDVEQASYIIGRTYAAMLPDDYRSENGVYYTPPAVVDRLLDSAEVAGVDWRRCRSLDPACGGGAFLAPLARRMIAGAKGKDRRAILSDLKARLKGYEIDKFAAWMSSVFLDATLLEILGLSPDASFGVLEICDSLNRAPEGGGFDLVVGNPPYGRVKLSAERRRVYSRALYGHANLYALFLDLALRHAAKDGVIAYVTPTGFLCGEYFKKLRELLAAEAAPVEFDFIEERAGVFDDVLQETLLVTFHKGARVERSTVSFVEVTATDRSALTATAKVAAPPLGDGPWIVPRSVESEALATRLLAMTHRLADWGYGVSTGPLVWNRYKRQLRHKPAENTVPLIWAESVTADGEFSFRAERRNHAPYFLLQEPDDWLIVRQPCVLLQRTTAKEQARRLIAAELPQSFLDAHGGSVTVENHLNMIVPVVTKPAVSTAALAAFLNSRAADRAFRCISGTVAVSAFELEAMPLPAPWSLARLDDALAQPHTRDSIESYCDRLYGQR